MRVCTHGCVCPYIQGYIHAHISTYRCKDINSLYLYMIERYTRACISIYRYKGIYSLYLCINILYQYMIYRCISLGIREYIPCIYEHTFLIPIYHTLYLWMIYQLQHTTTHCNTLQHTATHCNTLQHTATHCNTYRWEYAHMNDIPTYIPYTYISYIIRTYTRMYIYIQI